MKTPVLKTPRLILRPMTVADAENAFQNWTSDPDVARFMRWEIHKDSTVTREWLASEEVLNEGDSVYNWGFVLKETGELIGSGGLYYKEDIEMYELGYNLMKKYWNMGFATEAGRHIIDFGIQELKQKKFYCCHAKENPASGNVMRKIGFQYQNNAEYYSWNLERRFECMEYLMTII